MDSQTSLPLAPPKPCQPFLRAKYLQSFSRVFARTSFADVSLQARFPTLSGSRENVRYH